MRLEGAQTAPDDSFVRNVFVETLAGGRVKQAVQVPGQSLTSEGESP